MVLFLTVPAVAAAAGIATIISVGAGVGGIGGIVAGGALARSNEKIAARLSRPDLHKLAKLAMAILYGVSHQGFGKAPKLDEATMTALISFVDKHDQPLSFGDWSKAEASTITSWCKATYVKMEEADQEYLFV